VETSGLGTEDVLMKAQPNV